VPLANPYRRYAALTEVFKKHVARAPGTPIASVGTLHAADWTCAEGAAKIA
jgi:hypothetical protein